MGTRGRKSVDHHMGLPDGERFLIPKNISCISCNRAIIQPWKQFMERVEKEGCHPKEFIDGFICRSCKKASKEGKSITTVTEDGEVIVDSIGVPFEYKSFGPYDSKTNRLGYLFFGKYPVQYAFMTEIYPQFWKYATACFDLPRNLCWKYINQDTGEEYIPQGQERQEIMTLLRTGKVYDYANLNLMLKQLQRKEDEIKSEES